MNWINIKDQQPESKSIVMVFFKNKYGKKHITIAQYVSYRTVLAEDFLNDECDESFMDYDEENDCYWIPEGFYEYQYEPEINYFLTEEVLYWMPLPEYPEEEQ